jgi:diguanylate cyclase (GGDEF)-like protein
LSLAEDSQSARIPDPGRGPFLDRLAAFIADASRLQKDLALLCIRVTDLVRIQHIHGYRVGDRLLEDVYWRLAEIARDQDYLTWIGDGKFALVLREVMGEGHAILAANKIERGFSVPLELEGAEIEISLAVGIALLSVEASDAEGLLKQAEIALMEAEEQRRHYCVYSLEEGVSRERVWGLEMDMARAIENAEVDLVFQPKVELASGSPVGFEALIRWNHPEHGAILTDELWDVGQRSGCLPALTWWALQNLLRTAHGWQEAWDALPLSLRIPKAVAFDRDLVPQISNAVNFWGMAPDCLGLELDEDLAAELAAHKPAVLSELQDMGVSVLVYGFGAGRSWLGGLAGLPVSELKIDRQLIAAMPESEANRRLVRGIVQLAHSLGLAVSAQGVDDEATFERLIKLGCDYAQGEQIAPPMDEPALVAWIGKIRAASS